MILTNRLQIRAFKEEDLMEHHALISNDEVMKYIHDIQTHSLEESRANLRFAITELKKDKPQCYFFGIFHKETHEHIGSIGFSLEPLSERKSGELGYFIHKKHWGNGYTTEAVQGILSYAFDTLNLHKMITGCALINKASEHIMKKLGMIKEGHLFHHASFNGQSTDRVVYGMFNPKHLSCKEKIQLTMLQLIQNHENMIVFTGSTVAYLKGELIRLDHLEVVDNFTLNDGLAYLMPIVQVPREIRLEQLDVLKFCDHHVHVMK